MEEFLDERFPEVFFHSFGLQHQPIMQLTQLLYEAVRTWGWPVVLTAEVLWETWGTADKHLSHLNTPKPTAQTEFVRFAVVEFYREKRRCSASRWRRHEHITHVLFVKCGMWFTLFTLLTCSWALIQVSWQTSVTHMQVIFWWHSECAASWKCQSC